MTMNVITLEKIVEGYLQIVDAQQLSGAALQHPLASPVLSHLSRVPQGKDS